MSFYPAVPSDVTLTAAEREAGKLLADLVCPDRRGLVCPDRRGLCEASRTSLVAAGAGEIRSGDVVVFRKPVAVAPAVVRRDGRVQAGGYPADHVRLGVAEQELDRLTGTADTVGGLARAACLHGRVKAQARRAVTPALALRSVLLTTLMPEADYD